MDCREESNVKVISACMPSRGLVLRSLGQHVRELDRSASNQFGVGP